MDDFQNVSRHWYSSDRLVAVSLAVLSTTERGVMQFDCLLVDITHGMACIGGRIKYES